MKELKEIFFKASRKKSETYGEYRKILKKGNLDMDLQRGSDDVICVYKNGENIFNIDCNKKTGWFRIFWS